MAEEAPFFGLAGTLTDTLAPHVATWLEVLRLHGVEVDMNLHGSKLLDKPNEGAVRELLLPALPDGEVRGLLEAEAGNDRAATRARSALCHASSNG